MQTIRVNLSERSYPIYIENNLLDRSGEYIKKETNCTRVAVVTDDHVAPLYLDRVEKSLSASGIECESIVLPHGETTKCIARLQ